MAAEMVYRGLDPSELSTRWLLAYNKHRETFYEWQKELWIEAASELFGDN